jgi:signal transduction histidine kinase
LGLALARRIASAHGGNISAESEPERGSCFRVTIPAATDEP